MTATNPKNYRLIAMLILLIGCGVGGAVYWNGVKAEAVRDSDQSSEVETPENSKSALRNEEVYGGKMLLIMRDLKKAWEDWQHPKPIGITLAAASVIAALLVFRVGSMRAE